MLKLLALASLIACSSTTSTTPAAAPHAPTAPVARPAASPELITIETKSLAGPGISESKLVIGADGTWTYEQTKAGLRERHAEGRLGDDELARLKSALAAATWNSERQQLRCMAEPITATIYSVGGKVLGGQQMCDGQIFDEPTAALVTLLGKLQLDVAAHAKP